MHFPSLDNLRAACRDLRDGDAASAAAAAARQVVLTKPRGSLGQLEDLAIWLAYWQRRIEPRLNQVRVIVFAGNHGVTARAVSAYPSSVTGQMVENYARGGAAINQIAQVAQAGLMVVPLSLDCPTADFTLGPAMVTEEFLTAVEVGYAAVPTECDLLAIGEMGIGNTTAAAALCAALLGGGPERWVGRGTGVDDAGLQRKRDAVEAGILRHRAILDDPLAIAAALGGRELAAMLGATLAARAYGIPVLLDGFVSTAAVLPLAQSRAARVGALPRRACLGGGRTSRATGRTEL